MKALDVKFAPGAGRRESEAGASLPPQLMRLHGDEIWVSQANGCAITATTLPDATDFTTGTLAIMVHQRPGIMPQGIGLVYPMLPDEADHFAAQLKLAARKMRQAASDRANAALRKAAGK